MPQPLPASAEGDCILNIDKPRGWTSFDVVAYIRKRTGIRRVGHGGTLDPGATGVLPIGLGRATRILEYLLEGRKTYRVWVRLGFSTDTYDADGVPVRYGNASGITAEDVQRLLPQFEGHFRQVPPRYSAIKREGTPLYKYARAGVPVEPPPRWVRVYRITLLAFTPPEVELEIECGRGTYIRSIAHDLGERLDCGAHLARLVRTRVGPFCLEEAIPLETLRQAFDRDDWRQYLYAADSALVTWDAAILSREKAHMMRQGQSVLLQPHVSRSRLSGTSLCRAYDVDGRFLGVLRHEHGGLIWRPEKVFL